jgi:formate-dependent nitrite reductase membrane component NrfD|tara:strand:- start:145 stop:1347 length:1203 start_codon:yes stop_codon:yes gene_type:complete
MNADQNITSGQGAASGGPGLMLWVFLGLFVVGIGSLLVGGADGAAQSDTKLLIVSFLFLMGLSQAGIVFCAITRLTRAQWSKPYYRLAELSTLAFAPFAIVGFLLIYIYAQDELFYWLNPSPEEHLSPWLNIHFLLIRNLLGLGLFYGLSIYYVLKGLRPDLVEGDETEADHRAVEDELYLLSPLVLGAYIICNTFIAWDFGMMLIPHWHSTIFPILYWFGNMFAGTAALIIFPVLLGRKEGSYFGPDQVRMLGMLVTGFTLMWLYFFWAQFFVMWFGNLPRETDALFRQMYGHYGPYFWTMMAGCFFIPFAAFLFAFVKRSILAMSAIAVGINVGIWIYKYLMVVPVFSPDDQPFSSWMDIAAAVGLTAGFLALVMLLANRLPMYAHWELALKPRPRRR